MARNVRPFEFRLGKLGVVIMIVGLSILVFAAFLFGVHVGRHIDTVPEEIAWGMPKRLLATLGMVQRARPIETPVGTEESSAEKEKGEAGDQGALVKAPAMPPAAHEVKGPEPPQPAGGLEKGPSTPDPGKQEGSAVAPPGPVSVPPVVSVPPSVHPPKGNGANNTKRPSVGDFWLKVVAYREKTKAEAAAKQIKALGYTPVVTSGEIEGGGVWHRVSIDGFATRQEAEQAAAAVEKKLKGVKCIIRKR